MAKRKPLSERQPRVLVKPDDCLDVVSRLIATQVPFTVSDAQNGHYELVRRTRSFVLKYNVQHTDTGFQIVRTYERRYGDGQTLHHQTTFSDVERIDPEDSIWKVGKLAVQSTPVNVRVSRQINSFSFNDLEELLDLPADKRNLPLWAGKFWCMETNTFGEVVLVEALGTIDIYGCFTGNRVQTEERIYSEEWFESPGEYAEVVGRAIDTSYTLMKRRHELAIKTFQKDAKRLLGRKANDLRLTYDQIQKSYLKGEGSYPLKNFHFTPLLFGQHLC